MLMGICVSMSIFADNVVITGNVSAFPDGAFVDLVSFEGILGMTIAGDSIKDGKFKITFQADSCLKKYHMYIHDNNRSSRARKLYIRPDAEIEITGTDEYVDTWNVKSNVPEQAEYDRFLIASKDVLDASYQIYLDYERKRETITDKSDLEKAIEEYSATKPYLDSLDNLSHMRDIELLKNTPVTPVWLDKMEEIASRYKASDNNSIEKSIMTLYTELNDSIKTSKQGLKIKALLYPSKSIEIGDEFPDTKFYDLEGAEHSVKDLLDKWVVVVFWSAGCGGCHYAFNEMPKLIAKHQENLDGVLLSCDTDKWWRWATENFGVTGNNWNEGMENYGLYQRFGEGGLPTVVMVSPKGKVADIFLGFYMDRIEENLSKETK